MAGETGERSERSERVERREIDAPFGAPRWLVAILPIVLLAVLVAGFLVAPPLGALGGGEPLPAVSIDYTTIPSDDTILLHVTNNGPPVTISQVMVDEALWNFDIASSGVDARLARGESGTITIPYHWNPGFDYHISILTSEGVSFDTTVIAAQQTPSMTAEIIWTLAYVGFFVGVIPVALGMFWFPYLQTMRRKHLHAVLAFSAGILGFLVFDAGFEAFEVAERVPSTYIGPMVVVLGIIGAMLLLQAAMDWRTGDDPSGLGLAYAAALGIGLHNLAEGLAIGSAFALGRASLGGFLIVGFMIHNVTEGPVIVAPLADGDRPALSHFAALGLIAGAPAIFGGWIGNLTQSPTLAALFLAIGVGALLQVILDIGELVERTGSVRGLPNLLAFGVGLGVMYVTDLFVVL